MMECALEICIVGYPIKVNFFVTITSFHCGVEKIMQFKNMHIFNKNHWKKSEISWTDKLQEMSRKFRAKFPG